MKLAESVRHPLARIGIITGLAVLACILLAVSVAVAAHAPSPMDTAPTNPAAQEVAAAEPPNTGREGARSGPRREVSSPDEAVRHAWDLARIAGIYHFATDVTEIAHPARSLANVGRGPDRIETRMAGRINQPARTLEFELSQPGVTTSSSPTEARIEGDRAYVRQTGGEWQEVEDFGSTFAPDNDPLAFLAGVKNAREVQARGDAAGSYGSLEPSPGVLISRYAFDLDGPTLATYMRDQLERQLMERGELPLGVTLNAPGSFREMTGSGELWVDGRGLPLRLTMHLAFPEQPNGSRLEAQLQTDFSGFPEQLALAPRLTEEPLAWVEYQLDRSSLEAVAKAGGTGVALGSGLALAVLLLACRRSRRMYAAVVIAVVLSMVLVPLMQSERVSAFFEGQASRSELAGLGASGGQAASAESSEEQAAREALTNVLAPTWDPHQDPLAQPARNVNSGTAQSAPEARAPSGVAHPTGRDGQAAPSPEVAGTPAPTPTPDPCSQWGTGDADGDGVNAYDECRYSLDDGDPDSDDDDLSDAEELYKLGTLGTDADTDGDLIPDAREVMGFVYPDSGPRWYLNPKDPDTNGDGLIDSAECPALVDLANPTSADFLQQCDSDADGIPNLFEVDNDNDGVPDRVDLAPDEWADAAGKRKGAVTTPTPFDKAHPFTLSMNNLQGGWPIIVDLQMRPTNATHLSYAMNVLDWPGGDVDGQIQHKANTTFANSNNPAVADPADDAGSHGDMRLVPLLEIVMTGAKLPLKLIEPKAEMVVGAGTALESTLKLEPTADKGGTQLTAALAAGATMEIYEGACGTKGTLLLTLTGTTGVIAGKRVVTVADGNHAVVVKGGQEMEPCAETPDIVNGQYTDKMVDLSAFSPYGITARDRIVGEQHSVVVYVPLNVATDDTGGGKSAFQSHMVYWLGGDSDWIEPQQMRIIWLVQAITDTCAEDAPKWEEFEAQYKRDHDDPSDQEIREAFDAEFDKYCDANRTVEQLLPVQVYDESWILAGLSVREDHGVDVAVAYVNPALPKYDPDPLWTLSWGLGQQFVPQRDCERDDTIWTDIDPNPNDDDPDSCAPDDKRDITVSPTAPTTDHTVKNISNSTIEQRFDTDTTIPLNQRWKIDRVNGIFPLVVKSMRLEDQDHLGKLSSTETPLILAEYTNHNVAPTLLYAREERYRAAGLEAAAVQGNLGLMVDLKTDTYKEETLTGLQWAPYRYNSVDNAWEAYPATEYWDAIGDELEAKFHALYPNDPNETNTGRMITARAYSFALINGLVNSFRCSPTDLLCAVDKGSNASDVSIIKSGFAAGSATWIIVQKIALDMWETLGNIMTPIRLENPGAWLWSLAASGANQLFVYYDVFKASPTVKWAGGIVLGAAALVAITTAVVAAALGTDVAVGAVVSRSIALVLAVQATIHTFARWWTKWHDANSGLKFTDWSKSRFGLSMDRPMKVGIVFTFISVAMTWGAFVAQFFLTDMKWGSMATDSAFAGAMATMIVTVILFVIFMALGPIGQIVSAIFGLINAMAALICSALPQEMQTGKVGVWLCGGITGFLTNLLKRWIYSGTIMVQMNPSKYDRLSLANFDSRLFDEEAGVVVGNKMVYSVDLTNTIDLVKTPFSLWEADWGWQFNADTLAEANFGYRWQNTQNDFSDDLSLGGMDGGWDGRSDGPPFYKSRPVESDPMTFTKAGVNQPAEGLYLTEAYAVPEQECWGVLGIGNCSIKAERKASHFDMGGGLIYDVLPATLDGFYTLTKKGDGWALAWGQEGDLTFDALYDADGDGLSHTDDPDDSKWDADDDGLSDAYEINTGSDPKSRDSDSDGLTDLQEARLGTNPANKDSDGDGLLDCQEVFHEVVAVGDEYARQACGDVVGEWSGGWTVVYRMSGTPSLTLVTSNPTEADSDADGLTDRQEQVYGFNPRVWSNANVLSFSSELSELNGTVYEPTDGYVSPGQTLSFDATVKNELDSRQAEGLLWTESTPALNSSKLKPQTFRLRPQQQATMSGSLQVVADASGTHAITQVAGALIENLALESDNASLWLPFDDAAAPLTDRSGSLPPHDGACFTATGPSTTACPLEPGGGRTGGGVRLNGTGYVEVPLNVSETSYAVSLWFKTACADCGIFSVDLGARGSGGHDRHVFLAGGNICTRVYSNETVCTPGPSYADDQWHHLVHTFGGTQGVQKIYLDGVLAASGTKQVSDFTTQDGINIGFSNDAATDYFTGSIDDVRVFGKALSQTEVRELANLVLFQENFDRTDAWTDTSSFKTPIASCVPCLSPIGCPVSGCRFDYGPSHTGPAVRGNGASFDGTQRLSVGDTSGVPQLDLSGGRFTLSAWIYPRLHGDARDTHPQGILGLNSGTATAYPSLQRVGKQIRFSTGTGTAWATPYTSGDVLTENQWNHVVVTLDKDEGKLRLYVNGDLKGEPAGFTAVPPATVRSFDIGRSSSAATLRAYGYLQGEQGDGGVVSCEATRSSEMCMAIDQEEVWNQGGLDCTETGSLETTRAVAGNTELVLWEDDGGDRCGAGPTDQSNNDDHCQVWWGGDSNYDKASSQTISTNMASFSGRQYDFNSCGDGHFHMTLTNNSVPFYGSMDEVRIYGQALDQESIRQLYLDAATLLRLPLDDAPGAVAFEDLSLARVPASCAASGCPVPGTTGRVNRAAYFDSGKGSAISLSHSAANELANSFTVAAWIKPSALSPVQNIVSTSRAKSNNGWGFRLNGNNLEFEQYGLGVSSTSGLGLQGGRWNHVVAVVDATYHVAFYLNGARWESMSHGGLYQGAGDPDDVLLVGAAQALNAGAPSQFFDGQIDDVWVFNTPLSAARIAQLYDSAPALHLLLDEATGATKFVDNAADGRFGSCTETATTSCPVTGEGVRGQVGLAAQFDGVKDSVAVPGFGSFTNATVSAWVNRTGATNARESIVSYKESGPCGLVLSLNNDGTHQYPTLHVRVHGTSGTDSWKSVTAPIPVPLNTWVQLAGSYDGNKLRLYRNGALQVESAGIEAAGSMVNTCSSIMTVGSQNTQNTHWFPGAIDEVEMYSRALLPGQINDLFQYQSAWVEGRQSQTITVDNEAPTADILIGEGTYLANQTIWVGITANDPTSGVSKVEMAVAKEGGDLVWQEAARCTDNIHQPEGAWCGQFDPLDAAPEGAYTIYARATDRVGRTGTADIAHVYVDDRAPVLDQVSYGLVPASQSKKQQSWIVHLSGPTKDLPLASPAPSIPGSGVPEDGVRVTVRGSDNKPLGGANQIATVSGGKWSIDYTVRKAEPDGCYTVVVEAEDQVARLPGLNSDQVARHTAVLQAPIVLEASAPRVLLDQKGIAGGRLGPGITVLNGETTHRPVAVEVAMVGATGADQTGVRLTCQHGNEGSWYTIFDLKAGTVKAGGGKTWDGEIHHWSTCRVELTTGAPAGGVSGVIKVCGTKIAEWTGDFAASKTVEFVVHSDACIPDGCGASSPVTGVAGVDSAFRSVLPGSAFLNETPPANEVLHLPFEDSLNAGGLDLRDVSGGGINGACSAAGCPKLGQVGPSGSAAWFDGVDDYVQVPDDDRWDFQSGQDFTIAVWARPDATQPDSQNTDHSIVEKWSGTGGYPYVIRYLDANDKTRPGKVMVARYQGTQPQPAIISDRAINDGRFHHLAFAKTGATLTLYIDGTPAGTTPDNATGATANSSALFVGQRGPAASGSNHFAGMIDDLRIFSRSLTAAELKTLYAASGPLLVLPFEQSWAGDGDVLSDASGWGHEGTLLAGATDEVNKAVYGQVQSYALSLDGVDDYVNLGSSPDLKLSNSATFATWIYPTAAKITPILDREGEYQVFRYADGTIQWAFANTAPGWNFVNTGYVAQPNVWTHLAVVYDGGVVRTYANGALVHTYTGAGAIGDVDPTRNELWIGHRPGRSGDNFAGYLDELRIYGRALPVQEISDLYSAGWKAATLPPAGVGAERSSWSATVPARLEGSYQIEMRGRDAAGHVEVAGESSPLWRGEADNTAPRVRLSLNTTTNEYTAVAEDFYLAETLFNSPCGAGLITARDYYRSPWYVGSTGDAQRLYRLTATCPKPASPVTEQATACDSFGNCATCSMAGNCTTSVLPAGVAGQAGGLPVPSPAEHAVPERAAGAPGSLGVSGPETAGFEITIPSVITATQYYEPRTIDVAGLATSKHKPDGGERDLASVQVSIEQATGPANLSQPDPQRPYTVSWTFPWRLAESPGLPDGVAYRATVVATDRAGRTSTASQDVIVDVVKPAPVSLSLSSNGGPVESGATIRDASPDLALMWTPSSDGSGLGPYLAGFRVEDANGTTIHSSLYDPSGTLEAHVSGGEAQFIRTGLAARDVHGNERWQEFGRVIVDGINTPDYIAPLTSPSRIVFAGGEEWMTSGCTLLGADRRISRRASSGGWPAQVLYGTWDQRALRLAWTGANWTGAGDLFVYLDTRGGGTGETFAPGGIDAGGTTVTLPADLAADMLVWMQDSNTASLLRWDGAWVLDRTLTAEQFGFDATLNGGQTDFYLPFDLIGLAAGQPLGVLAFAADDPAPGSGLRIWATLPLFNPVNSDRVNLRLPLAPTGSQLALLHAFHWPAVADAVCPNGTNGVVLPDHQNDAALQMTVESDPPGAGLSGIAGGLYWVGNIDAALTGQLGSIFGFLRPARTPLPDGQSVTYRVTYRNSGSQTLQGAWLELDAFAALRLSTDRVEIGDILPGAEGSVTFQGTVDRSLSQYGVAVALARLRAAGSDVAGPALEWLIAAHRVDRGGPERVGLHALETVMGPGSNWLAGFSSDESGVSQIEIEVNSPSGATSTFTCGVSDSGTGDWSCPWDATAANGGTGPADGDQYTVRLRATDRYGQTSPWSAYHTIRIDALAPAITLGGEGTEGLANRLVRGSSLRLTGGAEDASRVAGVTVCIEGGSCQSADVHTPGTSASRWSQWVEIAGPLDYVTKTVTIRSVDGLGNRMVVGLELPVVFDNVPPVLTAAQLVAQAPLDTKATVLNGTVSDGGPKASVSVRVQAPDADAVRMPAARDGEAWRFDLQAETRGQYTLWVDAEDVAGNVTTSGPFTVDVTCTDAQPVVASLEMEPAAGQPNSLRVTAVISNAGPDMLAAGLPVTLNAGSNPVGTVTTTVPLQAGEFQALSFAWNPDVGKDYALVASIGRDDSTLPRGPLCFTPPPVTFAVSLRDLALSGGWDLVSAPLSTSNADTDVLQRGIDSAYTAILGFDGRTRAFYPDRPNESTLKKIDGLHGYWIKAVVPPLPDPADEEADDPAGIWRMAGETLPEDLPLPLAADWNLTGYLPQATLPVTTALASIAADYVAILGFDRTGLSYYPDLDSESGYNTLERMEPAEGYWIRVTEAVTLTYPLSAGTVPTAIPAISARLYKIRAAEKAAGVQPTYRWVNLYGQIYLPDLSPVPVDTAVTVLADGQPCGATVVTQAGRFGLLACYGDDETTPDLDGARPDAALTFLVNGQPVPVAARSFNGLTVPRSQPIRWTDLGDRWEVAAGNSNVADLTLTKSVAPATAAPGAAVQYILTFSNAGGSAAQGVVISDLIPPEITNPSFTSTGATVTPRAGAPFVWDVEDLPPGGGGVITISGVLDPNTTVPANITNTARITAPDEAWPDDNEATAILHITAAQMVPRIWLPLLWNNGGSD